MSLKIVVLAKQVPDTRNVGKDAMTAEGTVNRAALPAIFNPEDLNALEQALRLKEQNPGSTVGILTMGPPRAGEVIRQGLYRGADTGWLLTDRLFAGADTLATSYALATAIKKIGDVDIVIGGRQAIDGDTAQVDVCTANNTVAIITVSGIAKQLSEKFGIDPRRTASLLDTFSCIAQGIIPYGAQMLMASGLAKLSPVEILPYLYYPYALAAVTMASIVLRFPKRYTR